MWSSCAATQVSCSSAEAQKAREVCPRVLRYQRFSTTSIRIDWSSQYIHQTSRRPYSRSNVVACSLVQARKIMDRVQFCSVLLHEVDGATKITKSLMPRSCVTSPASPRFQPENVAVAPHVSHRRPSEPPVPKVGDVPSSAFWPQILFVPQTSPPDVARHAPREDLALFRRWAEFSSFNVFWCIVHCLLAGLPTHSSSALRRRARLRWSHLTRNTMHDLKHFDVGGVG